MIECTFSCWSHISSHSIRIWKEENLFIQSVPLSQYPFKSIIHYLSDGADSSNKPTDYINSHCFLLSSTSSDNGWHGMEWDGIWRHKQRATNFSENNQSGSFVLFYDNRWQIANYCAIRGLQIATLLLCATGWRGKRRPRRNESLNNRWSREWVGRVPEYAICPWVTDIVTDEYAIDALQTTSNVLISWPPP